MITHHNLNAWLCYIVDLSIINHRHILDCYQFSDIHISQGSIVTYLRWGGYRGF